MCIRDSDLPLQALLLFLKCEGYEFLSLYYIICGHYRGVHSIADRYYQLFLIAGDSPILVCISDFLNWLIVLSKCRSFFLAKASHHTPAAYPMHQKAG